jgi:hypothetical protein
MTKGAQEDIYGNLQKATSLFNADAKDFSNPDYINVFSAYLHTTTHTLLS